MQLPSEKEMRLWRAVDLPAKSKFLLLLVPRGPVRFGQVLLPEKLGDFMSGDVVHFAQGEEILTNEASEEDTKCILVKALPADCERVSDPDDQEAYRWLINC